MPGTSAMSTWVVGSGEEADVRLHHPSISAQHLSVEELAPGRFLLRDLSSSNGTYHRGVRISEVEVSHDDTVQLGLLPVPVRRLLRPSQGGPQSRTLIIGREVEGDCRIDLPTVSGHHAELRLGAQGLEVRDLASTNGTFVDGARISDWTVLGPAGRLHLGSYHVVDAQLDTWRQAMGGTAAEPRAVPINLEGALLIGRDPQCDVVIDHAAISWHHARIEVVRNKTQIVDLNSTNGVFVDGRRVNTADIGPTSSVFLGSVPLEVRSGIVVAPQRFRGEIRVDVEHVSRRLAEKYGGRTILDDVSLTIFPGELVALMGPSGAGKTTLLEVLSGMRRPSAGEVLINGVPLAANQPGRVGYVPQEDVMHRDLTVYEVLFHAARLRLPRDLPNRAVREHVLKLLDRMGLAHVRDTLVGGEQVRGISGGQRKRVNIALELITEPPLLFLDEPTSGLDATSTLEVLNVLHALAQDGKTIVMTIHQPRQEAFRLFDMVILLAKGGKLAYFGPSVPGVSGYFEQRSGVAAPECSNPADYALDTLDPPNEAHFRAPEVWQEDFRSSEEHEIYVVARSGGSAPGELVAAKPRRATPGMLAQTRTLFRRLVLRKVRDRAALVLQALQPLVVGVLLWATFDGVEWPITFEESPVEVPGQREARLSQQLGNKAHAIMFLMAATAFWLGCSNVARELVAERPVFIRERLAGLSVGAYVAAHFVVQVLVGLLQVGVLVGLGWAPMLVADPLPVLGLAWLTLASGVGVGMLVSAWARTEVTAISTLPLLLLPQLLLAGYLQTFDDLGEILQGIAYGMPIQWAFQSFLAVEYAAAGPHFDQLQDVFGFPDWAEPVASGVLAGIVVISLIGSYVRLRTLSASGG